MLGKGGVRGRETENKAIVAIAVEVQEPYCFGIVSIGCMDNVLNQVTESIRDNVLFSSLDLFLTIDTTLFTVENNISTLRVDNAIAGRRILVVLLSIKYSTHPTPRPMHLGNSAGIKVITI